MSVDKAGRAPKEFVSDNAASEFELWLEDANDYMAICKVTEAGEKIGSRIQPVFKGRGERSEPCPLNYGLETCANQR